MAASLHGLATPAHYEEWYVYGLFFIFAAAAQAILGIALLTDPFDEKEFGPHAQRAKQVLFLLGILGNLSILLLYVYTRTIGVPFGPQAGETEGVGVIDAASKLAEIAVILLLSVELVRAWCR